LIGGLKRRKGGAGEGTVCNVGQPGVHAVFPSGPAMAAAEIDHRPHIHRDAIAPPNRLAVDLAEDAGTHHHKIAGLDVLVDRGQDLLIDTGIVGFLAEGIGA